MPKDILLWPSFNLENYEAVLKGWLAKQNSRKLSRSGVIRSIGSNSYSDDRAVRAANMFDQISDVNKGASTQYATKVAEAKSKARAILMQLPDCEDRQTLLSQLGYVGGLSLKKKVCARAEVVSRYTNNRFPDLDFVVKQAVDYRNYLVHGGRQKFDYEEEFSCTAFLIDTLEFVYCVSDLLECGWDIEAWLKEGTTLTHPFGIYKVEYKAWLSMLREACNREA